MRNNARNVAIALGLLTLLSLATYALDGKNGYSAVEVLRWGQERSGIEYPTGFSGAKWDSLPSGLGALRPRGGQMAGNAEGDLFMLVWADDVAASSLSYPGLVVRSADGTLRHLLQEIGDGDALGDGSNILSYGDFRHLSVVGQSGGPLTAGHPVLVRVVWDGVAELGHGEIITVDPDAASPTAVVLHAFPEFSEADTVWPTRVVAGAGGTLYVYNDRDGTIFELTWTGSKYVQDVVPTSVALADVLAIDSDGFLYSASDWESTNSDTTIYRIDPTDGSAEEYSSVNSGTFLYDILVTSNGSEHTVWLAASDRKGKTRRGWVSEAVSGGTAGAGAAISASANNPYNIAMGRNGSLHVQEWIDQDGPDSPNDAVYELSPGSGSGGSGKGGGKGKNK